MAPFGIALLGCFEVRAGEELVIDRSWPRRKAQALIKLLALQPGRFLHRDQVFESLWPGLAPDAAANNLRQNVHYIRRACAERGLGELVSLDGDRVTLAEAELDTERFSAALDVARRGRAVAPYEEAFALYGGELLPDDLYEEWTQPARRQLMELCERALIEVSALHESARKLDLAAERLRQALELEPTLEEAHRGLMRVYGAMGVRDRALRQYQVCREVLDRELGVAPSAETEELFRAIESGTTSARPRSSHRGARGWPRRWFAALAAGGATLAVGGVAAAVLTFSGSDWTWTDGGSSQANRDFDFHIDGSGTATVVSGDCAEDGVIVDTEFGGNVTGEISGYANATGRTVFPSVDDCKLGHSEWTIVVSDDRGSSITASAGGYISLVTPITSPVSGSRGLPVAPAVITEGSGLFAGVTGSGTCAAAVVTQGAAGDELFFQLDCSFDVIARETGEDSRRLVVATGTSSSSLTPVSSTAGQTRRLYLDILYANTGSEPLSDLSLRIPPPEGAEVIVNSPEGRPLAEAGQTAWSLPVLAPGEIARFQVSLALVSAAVPEFLVEPSIELSPDSRTASSPVVIGVVQ